MAQKQIPRCARDDNENSGAVMFHHRGTEITEKTPLKQNLCVLCVSVVNNFPRCALSPPGPRGRSFL